MSGSRASERRDGTRTPEPARIYLAEAREVRSGKVIPVMLDRDVQKVYERARGDLEK